MSDYPLTDNQIAFYRENGYIQLDDVLLPNEVASLREAMDEIIDGMRKEVDTGEAYNQVFWQTVNLWRSDGRIRDHTLSRRIASIAHRLAGYPRLRLWHDHGLVKMPGDSRGTAWHQDLPYWPMIQEGGISCWMALDDVKGENGCMSFVPGTHKLGRLDPVSLTDPQEITSLPGAENVATESAVQVPLRAGSCTFHDGRTFHSATANSTERPRRAMVTIYMADGTEYSGADHCVTDGQGFVSGDTLRGALFPVLA